MRRFTLTDGRQRLTVRRWQVKASRMYAKVDGLYEVNFNGEIVTVTRRISREGIDPSAYSQVFASAVDAAYEIARRFRMTRPGSTWGCDGVGFSAQCDAGEVRVMRSGVGPRIAEKVFLTLARPI